MQRNWIALAVLLTIVAALGALAYFKPRGAGTGGHALSTLRPADAMSIRIERGEEPVIALEKREGRWRISAPLAADADDFHVQRVLAILEARPANRLAAVDLARFELAQPRAKLTIDGQSIAFGAINAVTREQYVLAGDAVYSVVLNYGAALPADVSKLIAKQPIGEHEVPVRLAFGKFLLEKHAGAWRLSPSTGDAAQDDLNRWVDAWRHAYALRAEPYDGRTPQEEIAIELSGGEKLTLGILQQEPEIILARPDRKLQYVFSAEAGKRLLTPPGEAPVNRR